MLHVMPAASEVLRYYHTQPLSGFRPLIEEMRKVGLSEPSVSPKKGGKRKPEAETSSPPKAPKRTRIKKISWRTRTPTPSDQDDSQSQTVSDIHIHIEVHNEEDVTSQPKVSELETMSLEVTFMIPVSIPITNDFCQDVSIPSPTDTISTPISIVPCPPVSLGIS